MSLDFAAASTMALYAADAEHLFDSLDSSQRHGSPVIPSGPCRDGFGLLSSDDWESVGQLRADDDLRLLQFLKKKFGSGQSNFYYGFLLQRKTSTDPRFAVGDFLAMVRGTAEPVEWALDATAVPELFKPQPHHLGGASPAGFYSIYSSMTLQDPAGHDLGRAATAIGNIVNQDNRRLTVVGHSLGAALASYLTLDLVSEVHLPSQNLDAYMIACPNPGDLIFAKMFRSTVPNYNVVNWESDLVPKVPPPPGFIPLLNGGPTQNVVALKPSTPGLGPTPHNNPKCNHHAACYALMLDSNSTVARALTQGFGCV